MNKNTKKIVVSNYSELGEQEDFLTGLKHVVVMGPEEMDAQDGYHTFKELYNHRITLYIALARMTQSYTDMANHEFGSERIRIWRSKKHSDGEICFGTGTQFVLGIGTGKGKQITYHIPIERWEETNFAETLEQAPEWDGHTSDEVIERLKEL